MYKVNECVEVKTGESEMSRKVTAIRKMVELDTGKYFCEDKTLVTCEVWDVG